MCNEFKDIEPEKDTKIIVEFNFSFPDGYSELFEILDTTKERIEELYNSYMKKYCDGELQDTSFEDFLADNSIDCKFISPSLTLKF